MPAVCRRQRRDRDRGVYLLVPGFNLEAGQNRLTVCTDNLGAVGVGAALTGNR